MAVDLLQYQQYTHLIYIANFQWWIHLKRSEFLSTFLVR
jgi:hypothetical protein